MRFREYLITEAKMVSEMIDPKDPDAQQKLKRQAAMPADRLAAKNVSDAMKERRAATITADKDDPASADKKQRAEMAAKLALKDKQIVQKEKNNGSSNSAE